jgi:hypothetical protein
MLQKEAVVSEMISVIKGLQSDPLFKDHVLVGGTALTLQLGHRTSTDIDLFTQKKQSTVALIDHFKRNYKDVDIAIAKDDFIRIYADGIKVEIVRYEDSKKILKKHKNEEGIKLLGVNEIAAMKLETIKKRKLWGNQSAIYEKGFVSQKQKHKRQRMVSGRHKDVKK